MVLSPLTFDIVSDSVFVAVLTDRIDVVATGPEVAAPQFFLEFRMLLEHFSGGQTLDDLHHSCQEHVWYALGKKVHVIFVCSDFDKVYFKTLGDGGTGLFQSLFSFWGQYGLAVFDRTDDMVEEDVLIVSFVDMVTHASIVPDLLRRSRFTPEQAPRNSVD